MLYRETGLNANVRQTRPTTWRYRWALSFAGDVPVYNAASDLADIRFILVKKIERNAIKQPDIDSLFFSTSHTTDGYTGVSTKKTAY